MLVAVVEVKLVGAHRLYLTFNNGVAKELDFTNHWDRLFSSIFQPLRDPSFFAQVILPPDSETIEWHNGADLAAEFLYEIGESVRVGELAALAA